MKKINKEILNIINFEHEKFQAYLKTLTNDLWREQYYKNMFRYSDYDQKIKKELIKTLRSETIVSNLLISELNFKEKCLLDIRFNNWYFYNKKQEGVWSPVTSIDISTFIFNSLEELFPASVIGEFKISRLNAIQKTLALKLAVELYKVKNKNLMYKGNLCTDPDLILEQTKQTRENILKASKIIADEITPDLYVTKYYDDNAKCVFDEYINLKMK